MGRGRVMGSWQDLLFFPPTNRSNDKNLYWTKLGGVVVFRGTILKNVVFHPWRPGVDWTRKIFLCPIRDKHSNESWNWFVNSSIPGVISPVLENFRRLRWIKAWVLVTCGVLWFDLVLSSIFLLFKLRPLQLRPQPLWTGLDLKHYFLHITWPTTPIIMQNLDSADYTTLMNVTTIVFLSITFHLQSNKLN